MSPKSDHPTLGFVPKAHSLIRSGNSTTNTSPTDPSSTSAVQRTPFALSGNLTSGNKMTCNTRSGAGSPSHEIGCTNRIFSKRAREIQAQEGVPMNVWGPPTSGHSTPLRENIPESPTDEFPEFSHQSVPEIQPGATRSRARAGTVPSRFSPGGISNNLSLPPSMSKSSRPTPPSSFKSPSPVSSENVENRNATFLSRLRAGSMPHRSQYPPNSASPFGPSVFSTNWSSGRERTATLASIASQGSNYPSSPSHSVFSKEAGGDNDMQMRTLDYLGLADTPQPPRATLVNPLLANLANITKQSNRFRSYSVNAKEKYAEDEEEFLSENMSSYEAQQAQLHMQLAATHAAIQQHNLAVQAYANHASVSRPRARTAGILESPASRILKNHYPSTSRLESSMNSSDLGLNDDYEELPTNVSALSLGRSTSRNDQMNPEEKSEGPTRALWLGSIPLSTTVSTLTEMFKHHGPIISARVLTHKNCGFVNFERLESAISAKALMNGKEIFPGAGPIRINFAKPPSPSSTPEGDGSFPSPSPDFLKSEKDNETNMTSTGFTSRTVATPMAVPALSEMKNEILRIVGEFGAPPEEKSRISCCVDASVMYTEYHSEIPPIPEPSHNRIHDAPKLRDIRKRIDNQSLTTSEIENIASIILPEIFELSSDYLGNTVVQKIFDHCSDDVRDIMLEEIAPHIAEIGVHKNGTWAAQKIIDVCKTPKQMSMIVKNLHPYAVPLFLDQYGNYVLQCCLKFGSPYNDFIFQSMLSQMWDIAQGRYGARAMRACLESHHSTKEQQRMLAATIALHSVQLATSANGALLLTWFLDTCTFPQRRSVLAPQLIPHLVHLCTHKVAYLTVLKGINQKQEPEAKDKIYRALFFSPNDEVLEAILSDHACGATLIFKVLTTPFFDESIRSDVVENVRNVLLRLKAQPVQGYKRLMDEVGLSPRGATNGSNREQAPNGTTERARPGSNQGQVNNLQMIPQQYGNVYFPQIPPADFDVNLPRPESIDSNFPPFLPYGPMFNGPGIPPMNMQQLQYQQSLLARTGSPLNNVHPALQTGFGFNNSSPGPDHYRNQNPHQSINVGPNAPPGFSGIGTQLGTHGYNGMNGTGMGYGLQIQEQINGRARREFHMSSKHSSLSPPRGLKWRSSTGYILSTVGTAMFTDLFLYGIIVPIIPFILATRLHLPHNEVQESTSLLLAFYAGASVLASLPAGYIADSLPSRRLPFLVSLSAMFLATVLLWVGKSWEVLILARIFQGISASVVWTVGLALILDTVGSRRLGVVLNSIFSFICVGELSAPVIGGVVYQHLGEAFVFIIGFALLIIDLLMRIAVVEKKTVKKYGWEEHIFHQIDDSSSENSPLLSDNNINTQNGISETELSEWKLSSEIPQWLMKLPIIYIMLHSPRLFTAMVLCFTHAMILAIFDATIPLQSIELFSFSARSAGLLFIPLLLPYILLSPLAGLIVDRYGTKQLSYLGLLVMAIPVSLLGPAIHAVSPSQAGYTTEVFKFSIILAACGTGLAAIGSQSLVDASTVIEKYTHANSEKFSAGGPYAQLYAITNMVFSLGLTVGPLAAGLIKVKYGYSIMNYCLSGWCVIVSILCAVFLGGTPKFLTKFLKLGKYKKSTTGIRNQIIIRVSDEDGPCNHTDSW